MEGNYTYSNISNINISFSTNEQSNDLDSIANNDILKKDSTLNKSLKRKFPKNKIFRINSLVMNYVLGMIVFTMKNIILCI